MNRTVPVTMPETIWGQLATIADVKGVRVGDVIADSIARTLLVEEKPMTTEERITAWNVQGVPDTVIAHRLQQTVDWVRRCRNRLNLPHVRFRRDDWPELLQAPETPGLPRTRKDTA